MNSYNITFYTSDNGPIAVSIGSDMGLEAVLANIDKDILNPRTTDADWLIIGSFRYRLKLISGIAVETIQTANTET